MELTTASILCLLLVMFGCTSSAPVVNLPIGVVKGQDEEAVTTFKPYHAYYGIPFAQAPVGNLRFSPPQPFVTKRPDQVISSDGYRDACIQFFNFSYSSPQSEDCLYLNVFTPSEGNALFNSSVSKKVMFWIHGGTFLSGDAVSHRPSRLVTDYDVIVITTQYRLGPFGFLSSGDDVVPGNNGLRDQIMALQWVQNNIRFFGGDPNDVTVFGQSAGASSASILGLSPLTKGLFTKVILQSGSALAPWTINRKPEVTFFKVAQKTACLPRFYFPNKTRAFNELVLKCLREVTSRDLVNALVDDVLQAAVDLDPDTYFSYSPVVDGYLLPKDPHTILMDHQYLAEVGALDRNYLMGVTNNEGIYGMESLLAVGYTTESFSKETAAQKVLQSFVNAALPFSVSSDILNFASLMYLYPRAWDGRVQLQGILDLFSDTFFVVPAIQLARSLAKASNHVDIYLYLFDHYPEEDSVFRGSNHGTDLFFLFDENINLQNQVGSSDTEIWTPNSLPLLDIFRSALTNMAKRGYPLTTTNSPWPRYDPQNESYLAVSVRPEVRQRMFTRRVSFWTDFLPRVLGAIFTSGPVRSPFSV